MRIARFKTKDNQIHQGVVHGDSIALIEGDLFGKWTETKNTVKLADVSLLSPIDPPTILCIGKNYKAHAEECEDDLPKNPLLFIKAVSALNHPNMPIVLPTTAAEQVDYEAELAVVIGKKAKRVSEKDALSYVFGYTCANDVSARDCQFADGQWTRGKSFDTFCPLGPWIETDFNPDNHAIQLRLNGQVLQDANTSLLIFKVAYLIHYLSQDITLYPGTVLLTGTPAGCGFARKPPVWLHDGDNVEVDIEGIGILRNTVKK